VAVLGILSSFPIEALNAEVEYHFVAHNLEANCIIWSPDVGDMVPARKGFES
jgi:hypothetical protein